MIDTQYNKDGRYAAFRNADGSYRPMGVADLKRATSGMDAEHRYRSLGTVFRNPKTPQATKDAIKAYRDGDPNDFPDQQRQWQLNQQARRREVARGGAVPVGQRVIIYGAIVPDSFQQQQQDRQYAKYLRESGKKPR